MIKILSMLVYFLKELIFDTAEESDFISHKFNARKFIVFLLITLSFIMNIFFMYRLYNLSLKNIECNKCCVNKQPVIKK